MAYPQQSSLVANAPDNVALSQFISHYNLPALCFFEDKKLTNVIHQQRLTPLRSQNPRLIRRPPNPRIQQQIIHLSLAQLLQRLLCKRLDRVEVIELTRENSHRASAATAAAGLGVGEGIVGLLGSGGVAGAEEDVVGLGLLGEEALYCFKALFYFQIISHQSR